MRRSQNLFIPCTLLLAAITLSAAACKKDRRNKQDEYKHVTACGVKDPARNIPWLRHRLDSLKNRYRDVKGMGARARVFHTDQGDFIDISLITMACIPCAIYDCQGNPVNDTTTYRKVAMSESRELIAEF